MNRREFLKGGLTGLTGIGLAQLGLPMVSQAPTPAKRVYRLTFEQTQSYHWNGIWHGDWIHQHNSVDTLWLWHDDDGHKPTLGWHQCYGGQTLHHGQYMSASKTIYDCVKRIHWTRRLMRVSFLVPRWAMEALEILPGEVIHEQA